MGHYRTGHLPDINNHTTQMLPMESCSSCIWTKAGQLPVCLTWFPDYSFLLCSHWCGSVGTNHWGFSEPPALAERYTVKAIKFISMQVTSPKALTPPFLSPKAKGARRQFMTGSLNSAFLWFLTWQVHLDIKTQSCVGKTANSLPIAPGPLKDNLFVGQRRHWVCSL